MEKEVETNSSQNNTVKSPIYKKWWFIVGILLIIAVIVGIIVNSVNSKIDWSEIELGEYIPKPDKTNGEITTNTSSLAMIDIEKISKKEYKDYVQKCIDSGYTLDLEYENWDTVYGAFNSEGYSLRIIYSEYSKEMSITLKVPETDSMKEIEWPTTGLGAILPVPKSNLGDISWNNSTTFIVHLGNTTIDDFNEYVKSCEAIGFTNDYSKGDESFTAYNEQGYKLHLMYLGANVIEISLEAPEENNQEPSSTTEPTTPETTEPEPTTDTPVASNSGMSDEFKAAMDSYESFMNEYIDFMKKYSQNPTDMTLISQYSSMMQKYAEQVEAFNNWNSSDMTTEEASYYLEVQTRVNQKLLEINS